MEDSGNKIRDMYEEMLESPEISLEMMIKDSETGEMASGPEEDIKRTYERWLAEAEDKSKICMRKYNVYIWNAWGRGYDGTTLPLIDQLQEKRQLTVTNFDDYRTVTEFLYLHDSDFIVENIDSDHDTCIIRMG